MKNKKELELLEELLSQAWALSDEEIDSISPGKIGNVVSLLDNPNNYNHCFNNLTKEELENPDVHLLKIMMNPKFFPFTCKHLFKLDNGRPLELMPMQAVVLQKLWTHQFPMLIACRGFSKSFTLALYSLLRLTFCPGSKVVIVAGGFRQAKIVLEYMQRIWYSSNVFRDLVNGSGGLFGKENGPYHGVDRWDFIIGNSIATALPLGDGKKIRGLRANYIITDEFACVDKNTIVETNKGLIRIGECENRNDIELLQRDGSYIKPERFFITPKTKAYKIKTNFNYSFICSGIHQIMTTKGWKLAKELNKEDKVVFENTYCFPAQDDIENNSLAWLIGAIVENGCLNKKGLHIYCDKILYKLDVIKNLDLINVKWKEENKVISIKDENFIKKIIEFGVDFENRKIPSYILSGKKETVLNFIKGIFSNRTTNVYTDSQYFTFHSKHIQLIEELQTVLFKFNILSSSFKSHLAIHGNNNFKAICDLIGYFIYDSEPYELKNSHIFEIYSIEEVEERNLYDFYIPNTNAFYGNSFVQHNSVPEDIYSTVVAGFGSVTADPVQNVKDLARQRLLKRLGMWTDDMDKDESEKVRGNQSILSGTAYYSFNHFAKYWKEYKAIINSQGDPKKLEEIFKGPPPEGFNCRDYCIIRIPVKMLRAGFMDDKTIARAQQTTHSGIFNMEFNAIFTSDSEGFFKRSLIEKCVVGKTENINPPTFPSCGIVDFSASLKGKPDKKYVYGIDPASENDSFAVSIIEIWPDHRRIVYCWTTKKSDHREKLKKDLTDDHDFYRYCTRKIRNLFSAFPPELLMIDAGGGGLSLREAFADPDKLLAGESPVYEIIEENKEKDTDSMSGMHIIKLCQFRDNKWLTEANHGMKKDLEDMILLFPKINSAEIGEDWALRKLQGLPTGTPEDKGIGLYDTLEDCATEIELMKDEMASIVLTKTNSGLEKWDVPDKKIGDKKGPMRKDRYSSILLANAGARAISKIFPNQIPYNPVGGGFINQLSSSKESTGSLYYAPQWFQQYQKTINNYTEHVVKK